MEEVLEYQSTHVQMATSLMACSVTPIAEMVTMEWVLSAGRTVQMASLIQVLIASSLTPMAEALGTSLSRSAMTTVQQDVRNTEHSTTPNAETTTLQKDAVFAPPNAQVVWSTLVCPVKRIPMVEQLESL